MEYFKSTRGVDKIAFEGFVYTKQKDLAAGVDSFECELRRQTKKRQGGCKVKIKVEDGALVVRLSEHSHAPNQSNFQVQELRNQMKRKATETLETPLQILT